MGDQQLNNKLIQSIWQGDAGLAKTYWVYAIFGSALIAVPIFLVTPGSIPAMIAVPLFCFYIVFINVGTWRAAGKYQGPKIWAFLSRAGIVAFIGASLVGVAATLMVPSTLKKSKTQNTTPNAYIENARKIYPELIGLDDQQAFNVIHQVYYPEWDKEELAKKIGLELVAKKTVSKLGPIDQWRYESCQHDAATAPTQYGVNFGLRLCREKFRQ